MCLLAGFDTFGRVYTMVAVRMQSDNERNGGEIMYCLCIIDIRIQLFLI